MRRFPRIPAPKRPSRPPSRPTLPGKWSRCPGALAAGGIIVIDLAARARERAGGDAAGVGPAEIGLELRELLADPGRETQP